MIFNTDISSKQKGPFDLLWENQNPSNAFSPQTVNLPTGYSSFVIEFKHKAVAPVNENMLLYVTFSTTARYFKPLVTSTARQMEWYVRGVNSATDGIIVFGDGYLAQNGTSPAINDQYAIPVAIYGLKFTL